MGGMIHIIAALTIKQPWASLLVSGDKMYEYRSWDAECTQLIAIHAGKGSDEKTRWAMARPEVRSRLRDPENVPRGAVIAIGRLASTECLTERRAREIRRDHPEEKIWGRPERLQYAWKFDEIQRLSYPVPARGMQKLWNWRIPASMRVEIGEIASAIGSDGASRIEGA
jgi:hypothetical protein